MLLPWLLVIGLTLLFFIWERLTPGRELPEAPGWYWRAALLNTCQLGIVILAGLTWGKLLYGRSVLHLAALNNPVLEGFIGWFIGTFIFYWWHRIRHDSDLLWRFFHQIHHSPGRIEMLTAFYKHPLEIAADSLIGSLLLFAVLGASVEGALWNNVFAVFGEYFYHSNIGTPRWVGYFLQRPEHHSIHHQLDVHRFNYGDITWWDRLFGTFREAEEFAPQCGFPDDHETRLADMLLFRDSY